MEEDNAAVCVFFMPRFFLPSNVCDCISFHSTIGTVPWSPAQWVRTCNVYALFSRAKFITVKVVIVTGQPV